MSRWLRCFSFAADSTTDPQNEAIDPQTDARVELLRSLRTGTGLLEAIASGKAAGLAAAELAEAHQALADTRTERPVRSQEEERSPEVPAVRSPCSPVNAFMHALQQQQQRAQRERNTTREMAEQVAVSVGQNSELIDSSPRFNRSSSQLVSDLATFEGSPTSREEARELLNLHPTLSGEEVVQLRMEKDLDESSPTEAGGGLARSSPLLRTLMSRQHSSPMMQRDRSGSSPMLRDAMANSMLRAHSSGSSPFHAEDSAALAGMLSGVSSGAASGTFGEACNQDSGIIHQTVARQLSSIKSGQRQAARERQANRLKVQEAAAAAAWNRTRIEAESVSCSERSTSQTFAAMGDRFPIIISYRSEAEGVMLRVCDALQAHFGSKTVVHGLMCLPGHPWEELYFGWMDHAAVFLMLLSENYFASASCCKEFEAATLIHVTDPNDANRVVLPLLGTPLSFKFPTDDPQCPEHLKEQLALRNCLPNPKDGAFSSEFDESMISLIRVISHHVQAWVESGGSMAQEKSVQVAARVHVDLEVASYALDVCGDDVEKAVRLIQESVWVLLDTTGDGTADTIGFDTGEGLVDTIGLDTNLSGTVDLDQDANEDGRYMLSVNTSRRDGKADTIKPCTVVSRSAKRKNRRKTL